MSNNQVKQGFGNVQDVDRSGIHPEVARRNAEIEAIELTPREREECIAEAIWVMKSKIWQLIHNHEPDFKAKNEGLNVVKK